MPRRLSIRGTRVAPRSGLPKLPVLEWPENSAEEVPRGLHWKTRLLVEWADSRDSDFVALCAWLREAQQAVGPPQTSPRARGGRP
jgi:hypothetical protein